MVTKRNTFMNQIYDKVYSKTYKQSTKPRKVSVNVDSKHSIEMVTFDFKEVLIDMLSNDSIMNKILFFDANDPTAVHPRDCEIGEVITSDVFLNAHKRLCLHPDDVLFPLILYNDEINFDSYSKLSLDPFSMTFG